MLNTHIQKIVEKNPGFKAITSAIEKEILHHDIIDAMIRHGAMRRLTFIGGTSLRLCYNSARLSEDLDFNGGHDFNPSHFDGLEVEIKDYLQNKYETEVSVNKPNQEKQGNTSSWKISIIKDSNRPDLPRQKMHIDVCSIPSFDIENRALINHYNVVVPTEGLLIPVQSLKETLADKFIALAYRARRIKPRDIWDIVWIKQRGVNLSHELLAKKLNARSKHAQEFLDALQIQLSKLATDQAVHKDFNDEMSRFIPMQIKERTIDNPDYWEYVQKEVNEIARGLFDDMPEKNKFDMGL